MMEDIVLKSFLRDNPGVRSKLRAIRKANMVPGVVYGGNKPAVNVSVDLNDIIKILKKSRNSILTLKSDSFEEKVIIKDFSKHVVSDKIIHIDFQRVSLDKKIDIKVPIKFIGQPYGVKTQGGVVEYDMRELEIRGIITEIPKEIEIDISNLKIGDSIKVKDLKYDKFEIREHPENIIVSVISVKEEELTVAKPQESVQPEVIEKGKKEKEGEEEKGSQAKESSKKEATNEGSKKQEK